MEERVLLELLACIRQQGRLPESHPFMTSVQRKFGNEGLGALRALLQSQRVRSNAVGYYPTINALRSMPEAFTPEIATARRLLPNIVAHFEAHQGSPMDLAGADLPDESGSLALPFVALLCDGIPVSVGVLDATGGAKTITASDGVWSLDAAVWPLELPQPTPERQPRSKAETLLIGLVDEWCLRVDLDRWRRWTEPLLGVKPMLLTPDHKRLHELYDWLCGRVFPVGNYPVIDALENFREVLRDFLRVLEEHGEPIVSPPGHGITKAYKTQLLEEAEFQRRASGWQRAIDEVGNLAFELARAVNLVLDATRRSIDPAYRFHLGKLPLAGPLTEDGAQPWQYAEYAGAQRYPGRIAFFAGEYLTRDKCFVLEGDDDKYAVVVAARDANLRSPSNSGPVPIGGGTHPTTGATRLPQEAKGDLARRPVALILKGGGAKGLAFVGALRELAPYYAFNEYWGTSAGAIAAVLLASGYTHEELENILREQDFSVFKDGSKWGLPYRLLTRGGMHPGEAFLRWMKDLVGRKVQYEGDVPLNRVPAPVTVIACAVGEGAVRFDSRKSDDNLTAGFAVRASMSIPGVFEQVHYGDKRLVDGGVLDNFPVEKFKAENPGREFVGLYLKREPATITSFGRVKLFRVAIDIYRTIGVGDELPTVNKERDRMVVIDPSPIGTTDFALSDDEKNLLVTAGRLAALEHLEAQDRGVAPEYVAQVRETHAILRAKVIQDRKPRWPFWAMFAVLFTLASVAVWVLLS